ncbi:MFS transporter [Herbaspirillum autotrophicum]|uniref:MFS transporter n=1 Tax=Herbaspirillum autotrophicum TaxID=180195 RepID=UPI00067B75B6|nr:MFS transporter [Herbaspirillum autotrophicum]
MPSHHKSAIPATPLLLIIGILLIASNLRAAVTGVAPLLDTIRHDFGLSSGNAGMLITLPLLAFAAVSPFAAVLARRFGLERSLFAALLVILAGIVLRSTGSVAALYIGTGIIGGGIAIGNVLLPSLLKRDFPTRIATMTAVYALTMGVAAALSSVIAIPLATSTGWPLALASCGLLVVVALVCWVPQLRKHTAPAASTATEAHGGRIWHSLLAWQVTLFLGLNSFVYYVVVSWLPAILNDAGYTPAQSGSLHGLLQMAAAVAGLALMPLRRMKDQRAAAFGASCMALVGILGLLWVPQWAAFWCVLYGLGSGATIVLGLSFVSLRVNSVQQAASLSGMAQTVGYLLAAVGPTLIGAIHDRVQNWTAPLLLCAGAAALMALCGLFAGRNVHIPTPSALAAR